MNEMTAARKAAETSFAVHLQAAGRPRGVFAAKKGDTEGELLIYEVIGEDFWTGKGVTAPDIAEKLAALKGVTRLDIYINSPGGDLFTGKTVYNELKRFPAAEKIVHVDGIAASAASLIAMAGTRIITESGGTWLIHEVANWGCPGRGTAADHRKIAAEVETETTAILGIYEGRTKCPSDKLAALMREDRIITAAEAKSYGLTDEISAVEQKRVDEAHARAAQAKAQERPKTPAEILATARADYAHLQSRFPAASRGMKSPGEPGAGNDTKPGNRQQENQK
jgi:ATP-dependent protease ClpP protease subunit